MSFREDFMWGAASASYQVEGAYLEDGKGLNIWDVYSNHGDLVANNETGNVACDHYHRYKEDIALMKQVGIKCYRFSVSWARILPDGTGKINEKGIKFYSDLVDELIRNGITPLVTLFHWDYPYALHSKGGWLNPQSSDWFAEYTRVVVDALSDRVSLWMTINEPQMFIGLCYAMGIHAPFLKIPVYDIARMSHNVLLAHGKAVKVIRENAVLKPLIGFAFATACCTPFDNSEKEIEAARKRSFDMDEVNFILSAPWWADPIVFGRYPDEAYEILGKNMPDIKEGDMEIISEPVDFYGTNIYEGRKICKVQGYREGSYTGSPKTMMEWSVTPETFYWSSKFLYERYGLPVFITENGIANMDWVHIDGKVHDPQRADFIARYLKELKRAADDGIDILGYLHWSFTDNFEWHSGYEKRFGLVYIDYITQKRTIKDSAYYYRSIIEANGENL